MKLVHPAMQNIFCFVFLRGFVRGTPLEWHKENAPKTLDPCAFKRYLQLSKEVVTTFKKIDTTFQRDSYIFHG